MINNGLIAAGTSIKICPNTGSVHHLSLASMVKLNFTLVDTSMLATTRLQFVLLCLTDTYIPF